MNAIVKACYFEFEADFVEDGVRCIPMIVRFKLDLSGIKLKLKEWARMRADERESLAQLPVNTPGEVQFYRGYLKALIALHTGGDATEIPVPAQPLWSAVDQVPALLQERLREFSWTISVFQWASLTDLQRFALIKLSAPGHENRNFPRAVCEFGLA